MADIAHTQFKPGETKNVPFSSLKLDNKNPRLPVDAYGKAQSELMTIFYRDYSLDELAESYAANGFFPTEALLILPDGSVIEGNRRLAALKYLFHDEDAKEAGLPYCDSLDSITEDNRNSLFNSIPVHVVASREDLSAYLGFRHINGAKEWPSASKARYVYDRVEHYAKSDRDDVFKKVGHEIGSNASGARGWYIDYALIVAAREQGLDQLTARLLVGNRFGVWRRLCGNQIYSYIGFDPNAKTYDEIQSAIDALDVRHFQALLQDIVPDDSGNLLLRDSRRASDYTTILGNEDALSTLRMSRDFELALLVAEGSPINKRLKKAIDILQQVSMSLENDSSTDDVTLKLIKRMKNQLNAIEGMIRGSDSDSQD